MFILPSSLDNRPRLIFRASACPGIDFSQSSTESPLFKGGTNASGNALIKRTVRNSPPMSAAPSRSPSYHSRPCQHCPHGLYAQLGAGPLADEARAGLKSSTPAAHAVVFHQGALLDEVHVVCAGLLKLSYQHADGSERIVRLLTPGDSFGLEALLGQPARTGAVAMEDARVCALASDLLVRWAWQTPSTHQLLMAQWQMAVAGAEFVIDQLSTGSARARVARLLRHLQAIKGEAAVTPPSRADMGALLGLTTETTSRVMAAFTREGLIERRDGRLLCQSAALDAVADGP